MRLRTVAAVVVVLVLVGGGALFLSVIRHGFSARDEPSRVEAMVARQIRSMGIPGRTKALNNPVALRPEVLAEARAHFADHCALCHANDGSGNTEIGQSL